MLALWCLSASREPFCTYWMCNAVRTHSLLSPYIKCAGCGWGVITQGCSPSSICYCCVLVKPPSWGKTQSSWSHSSPLKRWQDESSLVQGMHCKWNGCKVGELGYQWRFSEVWLLNPFECLWSVCQSLSTRECGLWYGSPEATKDHLFPPDEQLVGTSIRRERFVIHLNLLIHLWNCCLKSITLLWNLLKSLLSTPAHALDYTFLLLNLVSYVLGDTNVKVICIKNEEVKNWSNGQWRSTITPQVHNETCICPVSNSIA